MSVVDDVRRWLWLGGPPTDDPVDLLRELLSFVDVLPRVNRTDQASKFRAKEISFETRIAELETQIKQANARTREIEHRAVQLEEQLKADRLYKRIQELETQLKKANERTRIVEHKLVRASEHKKTD